ncbi:MAG: hypothetical protein F4X31_00125 [Gammaproteobacteria bacterium]|nr:hypothetical protein [Gammaproteobacteria bacterium]MYF12194.1 hypothetical protein [Gammaproteobacteria bacterium]
MATSLEATGVDRRQAGATLEAIANSIEKFAVTPERLRETLEASLQAQYERIKAEMDQRFDDVNRRIDDMRAEQRADSSRLFNLMLAMALGMAGVAGSLLFGPFF